MSKALLYLCLLLSAVSASAQQVLYSTDGPQNTDIDQRAVTFSTSSNPGTAGPNKVWDFRILYPDSLGILMFTDPAGLKGNFYPSSTAAITNITKGYNQVTEFYKSSANLYQQIGIVLYTPGDTVGHPASYFDPLTIRKYPTEYTTAFKDTSGYKVTYYLGKNFSGFQIDSVRIKNKVFLDVTFDAWGTVKLPQDTYENTLRENKLITSFDTTEIYSGGMWASLPQAKPTKKTTHTYSWYTRFVHFPIATITMDTTNTVVQQASYINQPKLSSIASSKNQETQVFPNPSKGLFKVFVQQNSNLDIFDIAGKLVLNQSLNKGLTIINTEQLKQGFYFYKIAGNNSDSTSSGKLILE